MLETFGPEGPIELAPFDPLALADAIERVIDDRTDRERRAALGLELAAQRTWSRAAEQLETAVLGWLR
jgi:glycosyltransferase involved in cell wall biosynthesis